MSVLDEHPGFRDFEDLQQQWKRGDVADYEAAIQFLLAEGALSEERRQWIEDFQGQPEERGTCVECGLDRTGHHPDCLVPRLIGRMGE
jgi:hypothetical protein